MRNKPERTSNSGKFNLRYIVGMKFRCFRQEKEFGLKQFAGLTGLSTSYINEIEKGRKYPKAEIIMMLVEGIGVEYDDLVSISMTGRLSQISGLFFFISSRFIPFSAFGITFENVVEKVNQTCERCPLDNSQCS